MKKILIVEDEVNLITLLSSTLTDEEHKVSIASTCDMAIIMGEGTVFDTMIIDQDMPEINGMELMERFRKLYPGLPVIIITGNGTIERAVDALRKGAYDFVSKPLDPDKIGPMVKRALAYGELYLDLKQLRRGIQNEYAFSGIIAKSKCMQNNLVLIDQIADSMTAPILIQGENGTGKEMLARAIHDRSTRKDKPFLAVDCSAIPEGLLEEMLFGRVDNFKENCPNYQGMFDHASGGTVFLDEVDDISLATQSKLLRVIQEREIRSVGSSQARKIDVRIIAATSKDLRELIKKQAFREDLYFQIAIFPIYIPQLRERKEDIPLLSAHFIKKYCGLNHKEVKEISQEALHALTQYDWPGNVRELENTIERALLICGNGQIDIPHLSFTNQFMMGGSSNKTDYAQENYYISRSNPMPSATTSRIKKILVVDDEPNVLTLLSRTLTNEGYQVTTSLSRIEAISMAEHTVFDLMTTDLAGAPGEMNGIEFMERFHELYPNLPVIIITGYGTIERAVEAMRRGAYDFITKPFELDKIYTIVKRALEYGELHLELNRLRKEVQDKYAFNGIIAKSKCMQGILSLADQIADSMAPILIQGEDGTGKEMLARAIHDRSTRKDKPFLVVDCSAIPETLLESELFGHDRVVFPNARRGIFEAAPGATIFLDGVDAFSYAVQSKLLRLIQKGEVRPVGSNQACKINIRIIAATSKNLKELIKKQAFREDLYFRIAALPIYIPPLRERKEDIPFLIDHFIKKYNELNKKKVRGISHEALLALTQYKWPGNVRELGNIIERALFICGGSQIEVQHLSMNQITMDGSSNKTDHALKQNTLNSAIERSERDFILQVLNTVNFHRTHAAKILGISRRTLHDKIIKYNLQHIQVLP